MNGFVDNKKVSRRLKELLGVRRESALWHAGRTAAEVTLLRDWGVKHRSIVVRTPAQLQIPLIHATSLEWQVSGREPRDLSIGELLESCV
jgi:hypothetical protein